MKDEWFLLVGVQGKFEIQKTMNIEYCVKNGWLYPYG